jgi:hypothetical protein
VQGALGKALGTEPPGPVVGSLVAAGSDMTAADRSYRLFFDGLPKAPGVMPPSSWIDDAHHWEEPELSVFVAALRSSTALAPVHDVAVVLFTTDPAPVGTEDGASVVPVFRNMHLQVVVANAGNEAEKRVPVVAVLAPVGGGDGQAVRDFVDLAPGQRQALTLGGLRSDAGGAYTLTVRVGPVAGESSLADNEKSLSLAVR